MTIERLWEPDPEVERWLDWAVSLIGPAEWQQRRAAMEGFAKQLDARMALEAASDFSDPIQPADRAAWYLYQTELYLRDPLHYDMPLSSRIIPTVKVLGQRLQLLKDIPLADERLTHGLVVAPVEIDSVLFELLVASAYASQNWADVAFISFPGIPLGHHRT